MPQKKNQHYVPQFYLKNFSDDGKMIGVYILKDKKYISKAPIKNQASKDYMYSKDPTMENALGNLEGLTDELTKRILVNPKLKLDEKDREVLLTFTLIQLGRTVSRTDDLQELTDKSFKQMYMAYIKQKTGGRIDDRLTSFYRYIDEKMVFQLPEPGIVGVGLSAKLLPMCSDLRYKLLINKTDIDFVTSDNPSCMYDEFLERMGDYSTGFALRGIEIYLPLSPKVAILYYDPKVYKIGSAHKEQVNVVNTNDVIALNKLIAANAKDILMCKDSTKSLLFFLQYAIIHGRFSNQERIEEIYLRDANNNIITGNHTRAKFFNMKLSFLKELPRFAYKDRKDYNAKDRVRPIAYYE